MKCIICKKEKLRRDFPGQLLSGQCQHALTCCLRCVTKKVPDTGLCPYPGCQAEVNQEGPGFLWCKNRLDVLYPPINVQEEGEASQHTQSDIKDERMVVHVTILNGDSHSFYVTPSMTVHHLRLKIQKEMDRAYRKQILLYDGKKIQVKDTTGKQLTLDDHKIVANSTLHLLILMYAVPENLDHIIFDLSWGYPASGRDYLDGSCWTFKDKGHDIGEKKPDGSIWERKNENRTVEKPGPRGYTSMTYTYIEEWEFYQGRVDFFNKSKISLSHSGDRMDDTKKNGHQTIEVYLKKLPKYVSHIIFTLSSFHAPSIDKFPNPGLTLYDGTDKNKTALCQTNLENARSRHSQAVILCTVARTGNMWNVYESGILSAGNAKYHDPLIATMKGLIKSGQAG